MIEERLTKFWGLLEKADLAEDVSSAARSLIESMNVLVKIAADYSDTTQTPVSRSVDAALDDLRAVLHLPTDNKVLRWVIDSAAKVRASTWYTATPFLEGTVDYQRVEALEEVSQRANLLLDDYTLQDEREQILEDARRSAREAASAAEKAQESAGVTGSSSLSTHFDQYAKGERIAAEVFRGLAMLGVVGALIAAIAFGPIDSGDWTHLTYRVATVAAAGTLAAYFARQAGQHRRVYNWAQSLSVQLKSFPAFIEPIPEEERIEVYRAFARRVLSAPPEKGVEATEDSVGAAQLLDLVTALAKRSA